MQMFNIDWHQDHFVVAQVYLLPPDHPLQLLIVVLVILEHVAH